MTIFLSPLDYVDVINIDIYRRERYPQPVDLLGVSRIYDPVIDKPVRTASMSLMRGIPRDFKGGLRNLSDTVGFRGFKISELTPNITRRGQVTYLFPIYNIQRLYYF